MQRHYLEVIFRFYTVRVTFIFSASMAAQITLYQNHLKNYF